MADTKKADGRPSKYSDAYCNEAIEYLAGGHSITALAGHLGVARATVFNWRDEHAEFDAAIKLGQAKAVAFWESVLINCGITGKGNATAAIFGLKNRASDDWADKVVNEHTGKDGGPIETVTSDVDTARAIAFALERGVRAQKQTEH